MTEDIIDELLAQYEYLQELKAMGVHSVFELPVYEQRLTLGGSVFEYMGLNYE